MSMWGCLERLVGALTGGSHVGIAVGVTAMTGLVLAAAFIISPRRGALMSPWSRRKRKYALSCKQWNSFFTPDGKLQDGGVKLLKIVRSGGIDPVIRVEVWPFLLGVYNLNSTQSERNVIRAQKRKEYRKLRRQCQVFSELKVIGYAMKPRFDESESSLEHGSPDKDNEEQQAKEECSASRFSDVEEEEEESEITHVDGSRSSDDESSIGDEAESMPIFSGSCSNGRGEEFGTWQRIIRLDAVRANAEWVTFSPAQSKISLEKARHSAKAVGLKDFEHLEAYRMYHAARLVSVLEAYAVYDPEIGYCQGMSDLLSPMLAVMDHDPDAFWCFAGFMRRARHNFRLDEVGIRRQLDMVSRIIRSTDAKLYRHLEKLQAEDCFFVYRMVVVLFRRELTFEQTLCLWEVMWADQAAIRAGIIGNSTSPPTEDLLLYAVAACVLQRRKLIVERYSSVDEIMRECNSMAGRLDVWKLLDDAHHLVANLHDRI